MNAPKILVLGIMLLIVLAGVEFQTCQRLDAVGLEQAGIDWDRKTPFENNRIEIKKILATIDAQIAIEPDTNLKLDLINRKLNITYKVMELGGPPFFRPLKSGATGQSEPVEANVEMFLHGGTK